MARSCNVGPKPEVDPSIFNRELLKYVDSAKDADIFEFKQYAGMTSGCGLHMKALAYLAPLIMTLLLVAPTTYLKKFYSLRDTPPAHHGKAASTANLIKTCGAQTKKVPPYKKGSQTKKVPPYKKVPP